MVINSELDCAPNLSLFRLWKYKVGSQGNLSRTL